MTTKRRTERRVSRALKEWVRTGGKATGFPKGRRDSDWISVRLRRNPAGRTQIALDRRETERLFRSIELGDRVSVLDMHGHVHTGRAVQLGPGGWKLNIGYPAWRTATHLNVVAVKKPARAARAARRANPDGMTLYTSADLAKAVPNYARVAHVAGHIYLRPRSNLKPLTSAQENSLEVFALDYGFNFTRRDANENNIKPGYGFRLYRTR